MARHDDPTAKNLPKSAKTVTVACKYPPGLLLRIFKYVEQPVPVPGGVRQEKVAMQIGDTIKINGPGAPVRQQSPHETAGGFALTHNVDADVMAAWMEQNADSALVKNGLIFVAASRDAARHRAEDHAAVRTGIEPLDMTMVRKDERDVVNDIRVRREVGQTVKTSDVRPAA